MNASYQYSHRPKGDRQTMVYHVWDGEAPNRNLQVVWLDVSVSWFRNSGSLNDLKNMAIEQAKRNLS